MPDFFFFAALWCGAVSALSRQAAAAAAAAAAALKWEKGEGEVHYLFLKMLF